jgi:hypothetical protein
VPHDTWRRHHLPRKHIFSTCWLTLHAKGCAVGDPRLSRAWSATPLIGLDLAIFANNTAHSMPCVRLTVSLCLLRAPIPSSPTCSAPSFQRCVLGLSAWLGGQHSFPSTETMSQAAIDNITCPGRVSEVQKGRSRGARWIHHANARLPCMP